MNHILDKEQNIKYLITWKLSRLSRRIYDVLDIVKQLDGGDKVLITVKDNINTTDEKDKHMLHFAAIFAEFERDTLIVQVKGGMEQKAREGKWNGGKAPLGYDLINKALVINTEGKQIVEEIYKRYISGEGYKTIADTLNNKGLRTREGKLFSTSAVKFILTNPTYKGWVRWGYRKDWDKKIENPKTGKKERKRKYNEKAIIVEGKHEAIISEERYNIVQELIENNPRRNMKRFQGHHLLSGLLRCPHCNYGMSIQRAVSKGKEYMYYVCNQYQNKKTCSAEGISKNKIEEEFFNILEIRLNGDDFKEQIRLLAKNKDLRIEEVNNELKRFENIKNKLLRDEDLIADELLNFDNDRVVEKIRERLIKVGEDIQKIEKEILNVKRKRKRVEEEILDAEEMFAVLDSNVKLIRQLDKEMQQILVRKIIKEIKVKDKKISEIVFNFGETIFVEEDGKLVLGSNVIGRALSQVVRGKSMKNNDKIYKMSFAKVYPLLVAKAERKGRTQTEVNEIITWLTGYSLDGLERVLENQIDYETFFSEAPNLNPQRSLIKGVVCGIRVEDIQEPLMQEIRYLDKLIDELAKGKTMDKILRKE